ncbi:MAG: phosphoribosylamine--glycine ligase [candidate division WOR-3 bacterium]
MKEKVLVIGSGGREHAIVWKLAQSKCQIFAAPGNGGISNFAECIPIKADNINALLKFAQDNAIDLTIVGPEAPLALGIVDEFQKQHLKIFGPNRRAAQLEASKAFAKNFCRKYNLPTANFETFTDSIRAQKYCEHCQFPIVIKASGLAAGKGVVIVDNKQSALQTIEMHLEKKLFGSASEEIVIEEYISGEELSLLALCDGYKIVPLLPARDYKKLLDADHGPNTGGMGSFAPVAKIDQHWMEKFRNELFTPFIRGLKSEGIEYKGIIYFGLILTNEKFYILEFNCRWGDPEAEVIIPLLKTDILSICYQTIDENIEELDWLNKFALTVIAASGGYPNEYQVGKLISGNLANTDDVIIFHCGTKKENNNYYTNGGRVLAITGIGDSLSSARTKAYQRIQDIYFDNIYYRKDIGQ